MEVKRITDVSLGAKLPTAGRFFVIFGKLAIYCHWITICLEPFEKTRFLTFESQLKKLNCSILL